MWLFGFLFAFGVGTLWWIGKDTKEICDDLAYLIELLEQNPDLVNKQADRDKERDNHSKGLDSKIPSREDLYR